MSDFDDTTPASPDHNAARLAEFKRLFPDLFTDEGQLDAKALQKLVNPSALDVEKYRFTWYGKARAQRKAFAPSKGALVYDAERSVNPEMADGNMIIEGENLEVLKLLTSAYSDSVKCIYIDPPYNTGNDFIYPDNYAQSKKEYWEQNGIFKDGVKMDSNSESNGRFHSDWLSMMYSRLLVARLLLKEDGVIFVSIDDNEVHNLRKLMDEVFGEENFISQMVWKSRQFLDSRSVTNISTDHEYLLIFAKNQTFRFKGNKRDESKFNNPDNDPRGLWMSRSILGLANAEQRPNLHYPITDPATGNEFYPSPTTGWRYAKERMLDLIEDECILFPSTPEGRPREKKFRSDMQNEYVAFPSIIDDIYTAHGNPELEYLFGVKVFDFPKPSELIRRLIDQATNSNDIILDFFAGSGTTAQAVMELNAEDDGNRKFILVQLPEALGLKSGAYGIGYKKISDITIERVKRVIEGHGEVETLFGKGHKTGFKVYQLAQSRFPRVTFQPDSSKTTEENVAALKAYINEKEASMLMVFEREAVFDEVLLKHGFKLTYTLEKQSTFAQNEVFLARDASTRRETLICLDSFLDKSTIAIFKTQPDTSFICLERALDTDKKWALKDYLGERLKSI